MTFLKVSSLNKQGDTGFGINDISFVQEQLQNVAIAGETGSGKSTLLKIIAGLIEPDGGVVMLENQKVKGPAETLVPGHPSIAYLSQHFELPKFLRVEQALAYANTGSFDEAIALYEVCRINPLLKRKTDQLSGGERQRIAMAKLLVSSPKLLLLDEPFSNLDMIHKNILKSVIHDIGEKLKITCMLVSHDPADTLSWANKIIVLKEGKIVQQDPPEKIYNYPVNEYVAGLFGQYNIISPALTYTMAAHLSTPIPNGKNLFVRPENFRIVSEGNHALAGIVNKVTFLGSHCDMEVSLPDTTIAIRTEATYLSPGTSIYLTLALHHTWYI